MNRIIYVLPWIVILITGCAKTPSIPQHYSAPKNTIAASTVKAKRAQLAQSTAINSESVLLLDQKNITAPYKVVGPVTIKHYNLSGIKRQKTTIDELLQQAAANMGGNAIINIQSDEQYTKGLVVHLTA